MRTHGYSKTPIYRRYMAIRARCENPNFGSYQFYGAKGIRVCERWKKFENFFADMGQPAAGQSIERIDRTKGYSPENCKWATSLEQANNQGNNRLITAHGETKTMAEWARLARLKPMTLQGRLNNGWSPEDAVNGELRGAGNHYRRKTCAHEGTGPNCRKCGYFLPQAARR